jgi:hypothetical protein
MRTPCIKLDTLNVGEAAAFEARFIEFVGVYHASFFDRKGQEIHRIQGAEKWAVFII